jgi:hypothetical protein
MRKASFVKSGERWVPGWVGSVRFGDTVMKHGQHRIATPREAIAVAEESGDFGDFGDTFRFSVAAAL